MRASLCLAAACLALTGCRSIDYAGPHGERLKLVTFGNKTSIGSLTFDASGRLSMTNYNCDQVAAIQAIGAIALQAAAQGMALAGQPAR